jgi:hypothetical protein
MSDTKYIELYNFWKNKSIAEGFSFASFWEHYLSFVNPTNCDASDCALGAKLAYRSLCDQRQSDYQQVKHELENCSWI